MLLVKSTKIRTCSAIGTVRRIGSSLGDKVCGSRSTRRDVVWMVQNHMVMIRYDLATATVLAKMMHGRLWRQ